MKESGDGGTESCDEMGSSFVIRAAKNESPAHFYRGRN
nr:hypothetical protein [Sicyoidochytrium minutum DNA virus]